MLKFLDFLKNLPEGDLYEGSVPIDDDFESVPYYVHISTTGKITTFEGKIRKVDIKKLIAREVKDIRDLIDFNKGRLNAELNKVNLLKSIIDSNDNTVLENFFNTKDFSDNAFRELRKILTNPLFEIRILSEFEGGGERMWGWDTNDIILRYGEEWNAYFKYATVYDIKDDLKRVQRSVKNLKTKITKWEKGLNK